MLSFLKSISDYTWASSHTKKPSRPGFDPPPFSLSGRGPVLPLPRSDLEAKRPSKDNCAKNLFSTRGKPNFTRHPSLIKLVKSIESDRRKINSAPSSPIKTSKGMFSVASGSAQNSFLSDSLAYLIRTVLVRELSQYPYTRAT